MMYNSVSALVVGLCTALTSAHRSDDNFRLPRDRAATTAADVRPVTATVRMNIAPVPQTPNLLSSG